MYALAPLWRPSGVPLAFLGLRCFCVAGVGQCISYFLVSSCFSMLILSLEKLVTCGVIQSYNFQYCLAFLIAICKSLLVDRIALELLHHGCDLNVRICTKHCVFSGTRRFRCREKLARVRDGFGRRRFAVESGSFCAHNVTEGCS